MNRRTATKAAALRTSTALLLALGLTGCPGQSTQSPGAASVGAATLSSSVGPPPRHALAVVREAKDVGDLTAKAKDPEVSSDLRLASLRRVEVLDPQQALSAASKLATSEDRLVRENAIALLARSKDPAADAAIHALPATSKALALELRASFLRSQEN
jgi:hypothetical protein